MAENYPETVTFRISKDERAALRELAELMERSQGSTIRVLIKRELATLKAAKEQQPAHRVQAEGS